MSKISKKSNAVQLSPEEAARAKAAVLLQIELQKESLEKQAAELKAELVEYVKETGTTDLGAYNVVKGEAKPKANFGDATDNAKKRIIEQLTAELPGFKKIKEELDWEKIYYAIPVNPSVKNALALRSVAFDLVNTYTFRKQKA